MLLVAAQPRIPARAEFRVVLNRGAAVLKVLDNVRVRNWEGGAGGLVREKGYGRLSRSRRETPDARSARDIMYDVQPIATPMQTRIGYV